MPARTPKRSALRNNIPSQAEYEMNEYRLYRKQVDEVEKNWKTASRADKAKDIERFVDGIKSGTVAERIGWLINGSYGKGSYDQTWQVIGRPRMNREAWLVQTIGALEYRLPATVVIAEWKKLTAAEKKKLDTAVKGEIKYAVKERERDAPKKPAKKRAAKKSK